MKPYILILALLTIGCTKQVFISPQPITIDDFQVIQAKVGLYISGDIKNDSLQEKQLRLHTGPAFTHAIHSSISKAVSSLEILDTFPTQQIIQDKRLSFVIVPELITRKLRCWVSLKNEYTAAFQYDFILGIVGVNGTVISSIPIYGAGVCDRALQYSEPDSSAACAAEKAISEMQERIIYAISNNQSIRSIISLQATQLSKRADSLQHITLYGENPGFTYDRNTKSLDPRPSLMQWSFYEELGLSHFYPVSLWVNLLYASHISVGMGYGSLYSSHLSNRANIEKRENQFSSTVSYLFFNSIHHFEVGSGFILNLDELFRRSTTLSEQIQIAPIGFMGYRYQPLLGMDFMGRAGYQAYLNRTGIEHSFYIGFGYVF